MNRLLEAFYVLPFLQHSIVISYMAFSSFPPPSIAGCVMGVLRKTSKGILMSPCLSDNSDDTDLCEDAVLFDFFRRTGLCSFPKQIGKCR